MIDQQPEKPFIQFLTESGIPTKLFPFIMYGLSLEASKSCTSTDGLQGIYRHISSSGRYGNTSFLVPVYGTSEFAQAFCRLSAVWGGIFVLRESITHFQTSPIDLTKDGIQIPHKITSVKLSNGRIISCENIICDDDSNFQLPSSLNSTTTTSVTPETTNETIPTKRLLLRHMILDQSILPEVDSFRGVIVIPSDTETLNNEYAIYVLQLDSSLFVAPAGLFVVYFLTYINDIVDHNNDDVKENNSSPTINHANQLMSNTINLFKNKIPRLNELLFATFLSPPISINSLNTNHPNSVKNKIYQNVYEVEKYTNEHVLYIHKNVIQARKIFDEMYPNSPFFADTSDNTNNNPHEDTHATNQKIDAEGQGLIALLDSIEVKEK